MVKYKDRYDVEYKVVGLWKDGRYSPKAVLHEKSGWRRLNNRGVLRGAKSMKTHLKAVYGKNLKYFKITKRRK